MGWISNKETGEVHEKKTTMLSGIRLLIIDEISTVSQILIGYMSQAFRTLHNFNRNLYFGGLNVVTVGDWYSKQYVLIIIRLQLPPTGSTPLWHDPANGKRTKNPNAKTLLRLNAQREGFEFWKAKNYVID